MGSAVRPIGQAAEEESGEEGCYQMTLRGWITLAAWAGVLFLNGFPELVPKAARESLTAPAPLWLVLFIWWIGTSHNFTQSGPVAATPERRQNADSPNA